MKLKSNEIELQGHWNLVGSLMKADKVCERIESLISTYLIKISKDKSGWNTLYQDPEDKRYWELTYPNSEEHGGGAPLLKNISLQETKKKYIIRDESEI